MNTQSPLSFLQTYFNARYKKGILYLIMGPLCICVGLAPIIIFPYGIHTDAVKVPDIVLIVFTALFIGVGYGWFFRSGMMFIKTKSLLQTAETNTKSIVLIYSEITTTTASHGLYHDEYKEIILADNKGKKYKLPLGFKDDEAFWNAVVTNFNNAHIGATNYIVTLYNRNSATFLREIKVQGLQD